MATQRDRGGIPPAFDTGLPPVQYSEDLPHWLFILGLVAGLTLLIALLRYAVDLLGVVFIIILVGFSIRAVSDWLTEDESVSGWALSAVSVGLIGTLLVSFWLFGPRNTASERLERQLPDPVQRAVAFLESHGWGQRVLLPSAPSAPSDSPMTTAEIRAPKARAAVVDERAPASPPVTARPPAPSADESGGARRGHAAKGGDGTEAEAAPAPASRKAVHSGTAPVPPTAQEVSPGVVAALPVPMQIPCAVTLQASPATAVVGTSVRLTAHVTGDAAASVPTGTVVFYRGEDVLGRARLRSEADGAVAVLVTLRLPIGSHDLTAAYDGDPVHGAARSGIARQTVVRR